MPIKSVKMSISKIETFELFRRKQIRLNGSNFRFLSNLLIQLLDCLDIYIMQPIISGYFFQQLRCQNFVKIVEQFLWDLWKRTCEYWYNHNMWYTVSF